MRNVIVISALFLAGCGGAVLPPTTSNPEPGSETSVAEARSKWAAAGLDSYHYQFENDCGECGPLLSTPSEIVVWNGEEYDSGQWNPGIDEMFDQIEQAIQQDRSVAVTFDDVLGYPTEVEIDMEMRPVDGGTHWIIHSLEPGLPGDEVSTSGVAEAERLWSSNRPYAYEYTTSVWCDCPLQGTIVTRVEGDRVVNYDILYDESSGGSIIPIAVDDMFADLADLMATVEGVVEGGIRFSGSARFHPELGYPIWVGLNIEVLQDDPALDGLPAELVVTMSDLHEVEVVEPTGLQTERAALMEARSRWQSTGIASYQYQLTIHAMATADYRGPFLVQIEDGEVVSLTREDGPVGEGVVAYTIEGLFDLIDSYLADGIESAVIYNELLGYPVFVQLDLDAIAVDGGLAMSIDRFSES